MVAEADGRDVSHRVRRVSPDDVPRVKAFLETHLESSLFLLSGLETFGVDATNAPLSGNYRLIEEDGAIVAVFLKNGQGALHVQGGGRADFAENILQACSAESRPTQAVLGEWELGRAVWSELCKQPGILPRYTSKEILYRLPLGNAAGGGGPAHPVARLAPEEFETWDALYGAMQAELGLPLHGTPESRHAGFEHAARAGLRWVGRDGGRPASIAALNVVYRTSGLVGGMFTAPSHRRRGLARSVLQALITDGRTLHGLETLVLFTGEANVAARRLYESLGFEAIGAFALFFAAPLA